VNKIRNKVYIFPMGLLGAPNETTGWPT